MCDRVIVMQAGRNRCTRIERMISIEILAYFSIGAAVGDEITAAAGAVRWRRPAMIASVDPATGAGIVVPVGGA